MKQKKRKLKYGIHTWKVNQSTEEIRKLRNFYNLTRYHTNRENILKKRRTVAKLRSTKLRKKISDRNYYRKNKNKIYAYQKKWVKLNSEKIKKYNILRYQKNKHKHNIRVLTKLKIKIPKGKLCEICKKELATQRHHKDYRKKFDIMFLCFDCHNKIHKKEYYDDFT